MGKKVASEGSEMEKIDLVDRGGQFIAKLSVLIHRQLIIVFCTLAIALSGCVKYDTGINFSSLNHGEIIERIQLGEQLNSFSQTAVDNWIASIEERTQQMQGKIERSSDRELTISIPFNNASDLERKIDRYFNPTATATPVGAADEIALREPQRAFHQAASPLEHRSQFRSHMQIEQSNFLAVIKNHLTYDIDLRSLNITAADRKISLATTNAIDLNFSIRSPWGVKIGAANDNSAIVKTSEDRQVTWQLQLGKLNHIDAIFWLPNPLAIGGIAIAIICTLGYYLKYRQLPWQFGSRVVGS